MMADLGIGLAYKKRYFSDLIADNRQNIDWLEIRPEMFLDIGGQILQQLDELAEAYPFLAHGITLNLGGRDPLDWEHLKKFKTFLRKYNIPLMSDHMAVCGDGNFPYQMLLPLPWTEAVALHVAERARQVQDFLEVPLALENMVNEFLPVPPQISESEFYNLILEKSGCGLLLDVADVYVNSQNYEFDALGFVKSLPLDKITQLHVVGCTQNSSGKTVTVHGHALNDEILQLVKSVKSLGLDVPVLLEREENFPAFVDLVEDVKKLEATWTN